MDLLPSGLWGLVINNALTFFPRDFAASNPASKAAAQSGENRSVSPTCRYSKLTLQRFKIHCKKNNQGKRDG